MNRGKLTNTPTGVSTISIQATYIASNASISSVSISMMMVMVVIIVMAITIIINKTL